jgi:PRTRC genetic system protein E
VESASGRHSGENENPVLTPALSCTGTPEELDAELGRELAGYVECHQALGRTLAAAKAELDAAAKTAQEEAGQKAEERKRKPEKPTDKPAAPAANLFGDSQPTASQVNPTGCGMPG